MKRKGCGTRRMRSASAEERARSHGQRWIALKSPKATKHMRMLTPKMASVGMEASHRCTYRQGARRQDAHGAIVAGRGPRDAMAGQRGVASGGRARDRPP